MRKIIILLFLPFYVLFISCEDTNKKYNPPIEVHFTEYSLFEIDCWETNFNFNEVIIINNNEKLKKYIVCTSEIYPEIDFSKYTLLLAKGGTGNEVDSVDIVFLQNALKKYTLSVTVYLTAATRPDIWRIAILVPKINDNVSITLNVQS